MSLVTGGEVVLPGGGDPLGQVLGLVRTDGVYGGEDEPADRGRALVAGDHWTVVSRRRRY